MTIAVAVRKGGRIAIAADTQNNFGENRVPPDNGPCRKLRRVGDAVVATTGWGLYGNILDDFVERQKRLRLDDERAIFAFFQAFWRELRDRYSYVNDQCRKDDESPFADLDASFLIVNPGGIYYVSSDTSVTPFARYHAVGSGTDYALGALHALCDDPALDAEALARRACDAAIAFNLYCGGPVDVELIDQAAG